MAEHVAESVREDHWVLVQGALVTNIYTSSEGPRAGENLSRLEVEIDESGPSLGGGAPHSPPS
jgi:hypothetical protein